MARAREHGDGRVRSPAARIARQLVEWHGERAHDVVDKCLALFSNVELAAAENDWGFWARPKQLPPSHPWQSWGFLTGRGFGKTIALSKYINQEVEAGRAPLILLMAQDEQSAIDIQVKGPSGLIATAPHWFKPTWLASEMVLVWPNGARAYVRTPEVPGKIRGLEYYIAWLSEIQSWPVATRDEAYMNALLSTRSGEAKIVWDATPRKRHPILKKLLKAAEQDPQHVAVRGGTRENPYLAKGYQEKLEAELGGTQRGREELLGEMLSDSDDALFRDEWINAARRPMPDRLVRRVIGIDPAITDRAGNDRTGIVECGLGVDDQVYVIGDYSGRYGPEAWASVVVDKYLANGCDCVVVETNKGGDLVIRNLRADAGPRGLSVVLLGKEERPHRHQNVVYVREVHARGSKEDRAQPIATAYERGRVSHVKGVELSELEDTLTTWEPEKGKRSPDALDALVHAAIELLGLASNKPDPSHGFKGLAEVNRAVQQPTRQTAVSISPLGRGHDPGGRI